MSDEEGEVYELSITDEKIDRDITSGKISIDGDARDVILDEKTKFEKSSDVSKEGGGLHQTFDSHIKSPKSYTPKSYKSKSYTPKSYKSKSYKSKSYTPKSYKSKSYTPKSYKSKSYTPKSYTPKSYTHAEKKRTTTKKRTI
jgi:hypothetical protein